jgi:peptidyl-prolyl cis-trans isomerase D
MLDLLRRKAQSPYLQGTVLMIIIVFVFWGVGGNNSGARNAIATVNDQPITVQEYQQAYSQTIEQYRNQFGGSLPDGFIDAFNMKQQVLNELIQKALIQQGGEEMGIFVSGMEVQKAIQNMPIFQNNGVFDNLRYKEVLKGSRLTPTKFEAGTKMDLLVSKVIKRLQSFSKVLPEEIEDRYSYENSEMKVDYALFKGSDFTSKIEISEDKLADFFENNKDSYKTEPQVKIKYISFSVKDEMAQITVDATELEQYYEQNKAKYTTPDATKTLDEVKDRIEITLKRQEALNRSFEKANKAYEMIILAGSLAKFAESGEISLAETEFFYRSSPPDALATNHTVVNTSFELQKGELSSLIETPQGYSILYVEDVKKPEIPPLEDIKEAVTNDFTDDEAIRMAREAAEQALTTIQEGADFTETINNSGQEIKESLFFSRNNRTSTVLPSELISQSLSLTAAKPYPEKIAESDGAFYAFRFKELKKPEQDKIELEKEAFETQLLQAKQAEILDAWLAHLMKQGEVTINESLMN